MRRQGTSLTIAIAPPRPLTPLSPPKLVTTALLDLHFGAAPVDVCAGGPPCQDWSAQRLMSPCGREDQKDCHSGDCALEVPRIVALVNARNARLGAPPAHVLIENVNSMDKKVKNFFTKDVAGGLEPVMLQAGLWCAATRPRLYWTTLPLLPPDNAVLDAAPTLSDILQAGGCTHLTKAHCITCSSGGPLTREHAKTGMYDGRDNKTVVYASVSWGVVVSSSRCRCSRRPLPLPPP